MKPSFSSTVDTLTAPPIPEVQAWTLMYDGKYGPLLDLSQAVPGYPAHAKIIQELGKAAASTNLLGYGPIMGEPDLRDAYANHVSTFYGSTISAGQTHITSGCNQAFVASLMAIAEYEDTVLLTNPNYFNHQTTLAMFGIESTCVDCDPQNGFLPDIGNIKTALDGVKAFALVSPNNPTGRVYPADFLATILDACRDSGTWLIIDETYRDFMDPDQRHTLFDDDKWSDVLIQLYSFSKSFCIPGHRLGAIVAGEPVIEAISKVMDNLQICAPRAAQHAVAQTIDLLGDWREENRLEIQSRAVALKNIFAHLPNWEISAMGAYFAYVRHPFTNRNSTQVAKMLAEEYGISCLPGAFFGEGQDNYLRFAFANVDVKTIHELGTRLRAI